MRKPLIYLVIFLLLLVGPSAVRYFQFYKLGGGSATAPPAYNPVNVAQVPTPAASDFVDEPEVGQGFVLVDEAHSNQFTLDEISYLDGRLAARGVELLHFTGGDLAAALRSVNAFVVIAPTVNFDREEIQAVSGFVNRGGRLLLIGDPTRFTVTFSEDDFFNLTYTLETDKIPLNSLANEFDIIFNGDYLYNTSENEGNFRNIILKEAGFGENSLAADMEQLVFYGSHSLQTGPEAEALFTADDNTWSSATDRPGGLVLAATSHAGQVVALGDIHFLMEPYYTVFDNGEFIAHVADFLSETAERSPDLQNFPYLYTQPIDLIYTGSPELGADAFDEIIALQEAFRDINQELTLVAEPQDGHDTLYLGVYNQAEEVTEILTTAGITLVIDPEISTEPVEETTPETEEETSEPVEETRLIQSALGNVQMSGTALILLDESNGRRNVVVLAASGDGLESAVNRLLALVPLDANSVLSDCLLQEGVALCPTNIAEEMVEGKLNTSGVPEGIDEGDEGDNGENGDGGDNGGNGVSGDDCGDGSGGLDDYGATNQGNIGIGDEVDCVLDVEERDSWTFNEGPATIDITVSGNDEMDTVIELYDPDGILLYSADSTFGGGIEEILAAEIPDDGEYTIVVYDYFDDGGGYKLEVVESSGVGETDDSEGQSIFLFGDDNGEALTGGFTDVAAFAELLSDSSYTVTTWLSSEDGPLGEDTLAGYNLVVWDSGDYRDEDGFLDEDAAILFDYVDSGGKLFLVGSSPTLFGSGELSAVSDLEVSGDDPILLNELVSGDVIPLNETYQAISPNALFSEGDEESISSFFLRGPDSENVGDQLGFGVEDPDVGDRAVFLLLPFRALPANLQPLILDNILLWLGF